MATRNYEEELQAEIDTWGTRLAQALKDARALGRDGERFLDNIRAYEKDAEHFRRGGDLVRAFESVVWAWAWLEIGQERGLLASLPPPSA